MIFAVDNAHWELLLYLLDDVYVDVVVGGSEVLLNPLIDKCGEGVTVGRVWWELIAFVPALYGSNLLCM